jgi:hypothetical protein
LIDQQVQVEDLVPIISLKTTFSRPRPSHCDLSQGGPPSTGEGGNVSSRLAAMIGPNGLLAAALLLSAVLVGLATAALN